VKYLFVDNFRGFTKTLLPIRDVNFFVGENSTGKTSILDVIKLLDTPLFWFDQRFNSDEVKLGNYKDIVSVDSSDRSYFRIGWLDTEPQGKKANEDSGTIEASLITFREEEGIPIISNYTTIVEGRQLNVIFGANTLKYKDEDLREISDDNDSIMNMFLSWAGSHQEIGKGYKTLKVPSERRQALIVISSILYEEKRKHPKTIAAGFEFFVRRPFQEVVWLAPIRTRPQRTYDTYRLDFSPEGEHTPYLIKKCLTKRTKEQRKLADGFMRFIEKFGRDSGLFKSIAVKDYDPRSTTSPFELDIILSNQALSIDNVGYGVSQSLPLIVEIFARTKDTWFAIQQPEVHLHPRAQAALGAVMFELAIAENKKFIVETHSDYTIDGFRLNYRGKDIPKKPDSQIVFFERTQEGNILHEIKILDNGEISDTQPQAYRDFFIKEQKRLLGL